MSRAVGAGLPGLSGTRRAPIKVLLLTWDYPPVRGGIQTWMFELARRLPDAQVTILAPAMPGDQSFDAGVGVSVRRLWSARIGQVAWLLHLTVVTFVGCLLRRSDLIVCSHVVTAPAALVTRWVLRIPYVVFTHAYEIRRRRKRRLVGLVLRGAALVLANSRFTEVSVFKYGVSPERVRILRPGVDADRFTPVPKTDGGTVMRTLRTLLSVSRLNERYKGHDTVIRALPIIKAKCPDVRYVVAGDGPLRNYLVKLAVSLGVEHDVEFLGEVSDAALPDLYRSCDVFVQISRESLSGGGAEGFGIVCLEAAASGKPVVAGRSGGLPDAVCDGVTGILVDPNDLSEVASAIVSVLLDPELAQRLGQQGRDRVLEGFTWDRMAEEARRLFAEAAGTRWDRRSA